jgi:predicted ATPase
MLSGEAGIGKSRLVEVLRERVEREGYTCITFRCSPYCQQSALHPVIEQIQRRQLSALEAMGTRSVGAYVRILLAEALRMGEQAEAALTVLTEALAYMETTHEQTFRAEAYRLQGELHQSLSRDYHEEAEICFHQALAIARRQQAKSWELRAAMSLSRLWQQQGKREAARQLLAPICSWFTEGFDTADLQEAKALLDELA